jgi:lipoate-protein ligase B
VTTGQLHHCALVDLGTVPYRAAWELQRRLVEARHAGTIPDVVLLLEHPHTYTVGRRGDGSEMLASSDFLARLGATFIEVDRGGLATYHGPGQLVGYPILDLRPRDRDVHRYLRNLEQALIDALHDTGISAQRRQQKTGVWVDDRKIASIGVRFSRWISSHGFGLNVTTDLSYFSHIVPCGMPTVQMTSVSQESSFARENGAADMAALRARVAHHLARVFGLHYADEPSTSLQELLGAVAESGVAALR